MTNLRQLHELVLEHLDRGEHVLHSVFGCYETTSMGSRTIRNGAFFATNMRLIFYGKRIFGFDIEIFPYEKISSIEFGKGLTGHRIRFVTSGNNVRMTMINVGDIDAFTQYMRSAINGKSLPALAIQGVSAQAMNLDLSEQDPRPKANVPSVENTLSVGLSSTQTLGAVKQPAERTIRDLIICGVTGFITGFGVGAPLSIGAYLMWRRIGIKGGLRWTAWAATGVFTVPIIASSFSQIREKPTGSIVSDSSPVISSKPKKQINKPLPVVQAQERTPAQNLALIDSSNGFGSTQKGSDAIYDTLLDKVSPKCNESRLKIADMTVFALGEYRKIDNKGSNLSLLRELATVQEGYEGTQDCAELYTALIMLRRSGYR